MEKHDLLKKIGFSEDYISKLNTYSNDVIEIKSVSFENEHLFIQTNDISSLKIEESNNYFDSHIILENR